MRSEDFFFEFYYPDEIVKEIETMQKFAISRALPLWSHIINNLITLFARALL